MTIVVPAEIAVIIPVIEPIAATAVLLLHKPLCVLSDRVSKAPLHRAVGPRMIEG